MDALLTPRLSVVIPAYNEAARLERTLAATALFLDRRGETYELLLVDDGSRDNTADVAREWAANRSNVVVLDGALNRGKGHAVRRGIAQARGARVLFMDADLATPIGEIEKLEAALGLRGAVIAIGSRQGRDSDVFVHQPWWRESAGRAFNKVVQLLATPGIHDTQCGFKLFENDAAHAVFSRCTLDGFGFDMEALFIARRLGFPIAEVPVRWAHQEGSATLGTKAAWLKSGLGMLADLLRIRWTHRAVRSLHAAPVPRRA